MLRTVTLQALLAVSHCFYLPGVAPREYVDNEKVEIKVNKLTSTVTQLPYDFYNLAFCKPTALVNSVENLGEVLHGSMIQNSPYELFAHKSDFKVLCKKDLTLKEVKTFGQRIKEDYRVQMIMDNLPAATRMISELPDGRTMTMYDRGYRLGFMGAKEFPGTVPKTPYINNHLRFIVKYHKDEKFTGSRLVGFEVEAFSVKHTYKGKWGKDAQLTSVPLSPDLPPQQITMAGEYIFTYDVTWEESSIRWASRWDLYLYMGDDQIHWFSILNSLAIVLLLTGIVAMIMMRTLRRDLNRYNSIEEKEELQEESGWKLVHGDVLRPPSMSLLLAATVGTGMQLLGMSIISIFCAMLGFLSPANRGGLLTATLLLFTLMGVPAGYFGSYAYKSLRGAQWKTLTLLTATLYPGIIFASFFLLNLFVWVHHHDDAHTRASPSAHAHIPICARLCRPCALACSRLCVHRVCVPLRPLRRWAPRRLCLSRQCSPSYACGSASRCPSYSSALSLASRRCCLSRPCAPTRSRGRSRCRRGTSPRPSRWSSAASCPSAPSSSSSSSSCPPSGCSASTTSSASSPL